MDKIRAGIVDILHADYPMTVRQVFYQMTVRGLIEKTEAEYKQATVRLLTEMRLDGTIPFHWIADNTRWMRKPRTFSGLRAMLEDTRDTYRRALWDDQETYLEFWTEKDAVAGIIMEETVPYDVPLMVSRGYSSLSFAYSAAEQIVQTGKPTFIYNVGDYDPSGVDISRNVEKRLREFSGQLGGDPAGVYFERLAVTPEQIQRWQLPTRPTKKSDSRAEAFEGESVELDAIPPQELRALVRNAIEKHIDNDVLARTKEIEEAERRTLERFTRRLPMDAA
jgi:hypothetical protein